MRLQADPQAAGHGSVEVVGLPPEVLRRLRGMPWGWREWSRVVSVRTLPAAAADSDLPPVLGTYAVEGRLIRFTPRFPFVPGLGYRVTLDLDRLAWPGFRGAGAATVERRLSLPALDGAPTTTVTALYPSGPTIPRNQLKLYLCFSSAMRAGTAFEKVRLVDVGTGRRLPRPFAEGRAELWDPSGRRLTLLLDPGHIKRGLVGTKSGGALHVGRRYRLEVDPSWNDASGRPLARGFRRDLVVLDDDREVPDPLSWRLSPPAAGTRDALVIGFVEPLDRALLEGSFALRGPDDGPVDGRADVGAEERSWSFSPSAAWRAGAYAIRVDPRLEDLAGNDLRRPFDHDVGGDAEPGHEEPVVLAFAVE